MTDAAVLQTGGALAMLAGVLLFWKDYRDGENRARFGPLEFSLSAPSLIIFIVGAALFIFPFTQLFRDKASRTSEVVVHQPSTNPRMIPEGSTRTSTPEASPEIMDIPSLKGKKIDVDIEYCDIPEEQIAGLAIVLRSNLSQSTVTATKKFSAFEKTTYIMFDQGASESLVRNIISLIQSFTSIRPIQLQRSPEDGSAMIAYLTGPNCPVASN